MCFRRKQKVDSLRQSVSHQTTSILERTHETANNANENISEENRRAKITLAKLDMYDFSLPILFKGAEETIREAMSGIFIPIHQFGTRSAEY